jgi:hypothetical protein
MMRRDKPMSEKRDRDLISASDLELGAYESPQLIELGDLSQLTAYSVSVRVP